MDWAPEVQAAIVTLAGQWAFDWANERQDRGSSSDWDKIFIEDFVYDYNLLVRALSQAEKSEK
jgi:hypothetical protein